MARFNANLIVVALLVLFFMPCRTLAAMKVVADVASDLRFQWKLNGDYIYIPSGEQLIDMKRHFPSDFPFGSVENVKGMWIVLPSLSPTFVSQNVSMWMNKVTFSFSTSAQLLDNVMVRHNSAGSPVINIIGNGRNHTETPTAVTDGWTDISISLGGTGRFTIEAYTTGEHDYILIDRIEATFVETTTSPRPPRSTTHRPKPFSGTPSRNSDPSILTFALMLQFFTFCFV